MSVERAWPGGLVWRWGAALAVALPLAVLTPPAAAQSPTMAPLPPHGTLLEGGLRWHGVDDALASAARYQGDAVTLGAAHRYRSAGWRIGLGGSWTAGRLYPAGLEDPTSYEESLSVTVDNWFARRVWRSGDGRWAAFAGPAVAVDVGLRRHAYGGDPSYRYDNAFMGVEATAILEWWPTGGGRLSERVAVPLAGLAVRTDYTGLAAPGPRVSVDLPPTFLLFRHRLEYRLPVRGRLALNVHHEGSVLRHTEPLDHAVAWHRLGLALEIAWGAP
ncbi:MAG: hypothetical protein R6U63_08620 [Longimicrobiales bacterium]